ncbi:MAG: hypothetical protein E7605_02795 [Ruminococcaceae bacterium]|nr:hypothetical protein [Oscillospiraceae bacterium]
MMKKSYLRSFLLCLLCALLICSPLALTSCGPDEPTPTPPEDDTPPTSEPPEPSEPMIVLAGEGAENPYIVVRSESVHSGSDISKGAAALCKAINTRFGSDLNITTDWTGVGGVAESPYEILVGTTNRDASPKVDKDLGVNEFIIRMVDTKLVITASSPSGVTYAINYFIEHYVDAQTASLKVPASLDYKGEYTVYYEVESAKGSGATKYDTALALACLQGIVNRESKSKVYVNSGGGNDKWLQTMQADGRWLADVPFEKLKGFDALLDLFVSYVKTVVIWDTNVPATVNVATTVAGVEDGLVMSYDMYKKYETKLNNAEIIDLRDKFFGSDTVSAKNEAYRWAIENYLKKGLCSTDLLCHYMDAWNIKGASGRRDGGDDAYVSIRDWAVYNRAFVIDLSPWNDEAPLDDPNQKVGTDYETFTMILEYLMEETKDSEPYEMAGFFDFTKYSRTGDNYLSKHETVPTEWEYVWLISAYNGYHNTCIEWSWNESFHSQYDGAQQLENNRPEELLDLEEDTTYLCFFMADYDSTYPLYRFLQDHWADPRRGELPLAWGINPNLLDTYPDIIEYYYETATPNDYFTSDASAAGYFNPSRVPDETWDIMLEHNIKYFERADMTIAPMILDQDRLDEQSLEMMSQFAPDGLSTIIIDQHSQGGSQAPAGMYGDTPTDRLDNSFNSSSVETGAASLENIVRYGYNRKLGATKSGSSLSLIRVVWKSPSYICEVVEAYKDAHPDENVVVVDIYNYFNLLAQDLED